MNDVRTSLIEIENAQYLQTMREFVKTLNTKGVQERFVEEIRT
jgi:hypothetical protein